MKFLNFLHYFIINLMGYHVLPRFIGYNGYEWHNVVFCSISDNYWHIFYSRFNDKRDGQSTIEMIDVSSRFKYIAFLKTLCVLFRMRKNIVFSIDNY